jgi:hypothetical protein
LRHPGGRLRRVGRWRFIGRCRRGRMGTLLAIYRTNKTIREIFLFILLCVIS